MLDRVVVLQVCCLVATIGCVGLPQRAESRVVLTEPAPTGLNGLPAAPFDFPTLYRVVRTLEAALGAGDLDRFQRDLDLVVPSLGSDVGPDGRVMIAQIRRLASLAGVLGGNADEVAGAGLRFGSVAASPPAAR